MNGTRDTNETPAGDRSELDPREAAKLLEQTRRQAQRELDIRPPLLMAAGAVVALIAYGVVWLSVRGQHPYEGPSAAALVVLYSTLAVWGATFATFFRRATSGVSGRSSRQRRHEGAVFGTIWVTVYVFQGALHHAGASHAIVYGIYPAAAPLIIVGAAAAAHGPPRRTGRWRRTRSQRSCSARWQRSPARPLCGQSSASACPCCCSSAPASSTGRCARDGAGMSADTLDPLIHVPARLRIVVTLATLGEGDTLSFTRLQDMIGLTPGNLITHLRKLEDAGYLTSEKTGNGVASRTAVALTGRGRAALDTYTNALRDLLGGL